MGLVLASQNPVDLDYKGLSNVGTWFLGRLQTERDKMRLMDGLEGAAAGGSFDRAKMEQILSGLSNRVFLLHDVHQDEPVLFQTRWAFSYLRGPLTSEQIGMLMADRKKTTARPRLKSEREGVRRRGGAARPRPVLPSEITERFRLPTDNLAQR